MEDLIEITKGNIKAAEDSREMTTDVSDKMYYTGVITQGKLTLATIEYLHLNK